MNTHLKNQYRRRKPNYAGLPSLSRLLALYALVTVSATQGAEVTVKIENLAPTNGTYQTPVFLGFHEGSFELFKMGSAASPGLESLAEDGDVSTLVAAFDAGGAGRVHAVTSGGPIASGESRLLTVNLSPTTRYLTFASMVLPSNDAFAGNEDPHGLPVFDAAGAFIGGSFLVMGSQVWDAGTEVNDELPMNTAFFGQTTPNTGVTQNGTVQPHAGFKAKGQGGILDAAMFTNADFKAPDYRVLRITLSTEIRITQIVKSETGLQLSWTGSAGPYMIQSKVSLTDAAWTIGSTTMENTLNVPIQGQMGFFRVMTP